MPSKRAWFVLLAIPLIVLLSTAAATSAPASQIPDSDQIRTAAESGMAAGGDAPIAADFDGAGEAATPLQMLAQMADAPPSAKLAPALRAADAGQGNDRLLIVVVSAAPVDLSGFAERVHSFTWPAGEYVSMLRARSSDLLDIAALDGVAQVTSGEVDLLAQPGGPVQIPSELLAAPLAGAEVDGVPASELASAGAAPGDPVARRDGDGGEGDLLGWHDALEGHSAAEAWAMGYRGEGVLVGVLDTGVDFAHQDLQGTWRTLPDGHAYEGWPQVYDPTSAYLYATARAVDDDTELLRSALGGLIEMYQESEVSEEDRDGETVNTACFQPLLGPLNGTDRTLADEACDFVVPNSKGGVVRFGHHPDRNLAGIRSPGGPPATRVGEFVGVLLVDANEAGTFDTVYVDLDSDHDFTDETPLTKDSPLSWRDVDRVPDGVADLSGGLLYFLADGVTPIPGAYLWGLEGDMPGAGTLVGLFFDQDAHGTLCASNVASQGRLGATRGLLAFRDLPGGVPEALNPGMAPDAKVIGVGNVYSSDIVFESAWRYVLFGHDPDDPSDDVPIASNSYGWSDVDNDGWDADSRLIDYYVRQYGPHTTFLVSTGNGGPGYGTIAPPSPVTSMGIGSSTQFGSAVGLSITDTLQVTFGDIAEMSNRGPTADGRAGPDVTANGANGWGAVPLNLLGANAAMINAGVGLGSRANVPWGGTSRSSPIAAGGLALTYEAFMERTGEWPTWQEARAIYKSAARYAGYDVFTMGSGVVDIADAVSIAAGLHGVYATPSEWTPGSYRDERHPGFAELMYPGGSDEVEITLHNTSDSPAQVTVTGATLRLLDGGESLQLDTDLAVESEYNSAIPNYLVPLDADQIPAGAELAVVYGRLPLDQADIDRDDEPALENAFKLRLIQHTDIDGDGALWTDVDGNDAVGFATVDGSIDWANAEIDRYEFETLNEHSAETNNWTVMAHHPLERWNDGLYVGIWHSEMSCADAEDPATCTGRTPLAPNTTIALRVEYYAYEPWDWLAFDDGTGSAALEVPAAGDQGFTASITVPDEAAPGSYGGAVLVDYHRAPDDVQIDTGSGYELPQLRVVVPVNVNVATDYAWLGSQTLGGQAARDDYAPLDNGVLRGGVDRGWRPETGDWRFFFVDAPDPTPGTHWLLRTSWADEIEASTDIDTSIWSSQADRFSDPAHSDNGEDDWSDPAWYGPYTLEKAGGSADALVDSGTWRFQTTSGRNEDWVSAPASEGLTELMLHNVLFSGSQFAVPYEVALSSINVWPDHLELYADACKPLRITSQIALDEFELLAAGLTATEEITGASVLPVEPYTHSIEVSTVAAKFVVDLSSDSDTDLDLALLYDEDGDGQPDVELARSDSPESVERIELPGLQPAGTYFAVVESLGPPLSEAAVFDLTVDVVHGDDLVAQSVPDAVEAGIEYVIQVCTADPPDVDGPLDGMIAFGSSGGPAAMMVPVTWVAEAPEVKVYVPAADRP